MPGVESELAADLQAVMEADNPTKEIAALGLAAAIHNYSGGAGGAHICVVIGATSSGSASSFDPFANGSYGAPSFSTPSSGGITFDPAAGTFTFATAGSYLVNVALSVDIDSGEDAELTVNVGGSPVLEVSRFIETGQEKQIVAFPVVVVGAGGVLTFSVDSSGSGSVVVHPGSHVSIFRAG